MEKPYIFLDAAIAHFESERKEALAVLTLYLSEPSAIGDHPEILKVIKEYTKKLGFKFPVAIDYEWETLNAWWLKTNPGEWTSVSFLLDRKGIVKYIHPGGQYIKGDGEYEKLQQEIEKLLKLNSLH